MRGTHVAGWSNFFVAEVGASAALAGLIFVGVSINLNRILAAHGLPELAVAALAALFTVLAASTLLLVPSQRREIVGSELLAVGLAGWAVQSAVQVFRMRGLERQYVLPFAAQAALGQIATLPFVIAGLVVLLQGESGLYWLVPGVVFSFLFALTSAWVLLIEINR